MNEAPGLPLIVNHMGELVENNVLGRKVAAEGFEGPDLDPSSGGGGQGLIGFPSYSAQEGLG